MFGYLNDQVQQVRFNNSYNPLPLDQRSPELATVFRHIESGAFGDSSIYDALLKTVSNVISQNPGWQRADKNSGLRTWLLSRFKRLWIIPRRSEIGWWALGWWSWGMDQESHYHFILHGRFQLRPICSGWVFDNIILWPSWGSAKADEIDYADGIWGVESERVPE